MASYINAADTMLLTSRHEGSPNTVKEALACNLPVVATDVGEVADQLDGFEFSVVCQDDSGLVDAHSDRRGSSTVPTAVLGVLVVVLGMLRDKRENETLGRHESPADADTEEVSDQPGQPPRVG